MTQPGSPGLPPIRTQPVPQPPIGSPHAPGRYRCLAVYRWSKQKSVEVSLTYYNLGEAPGSAGVPGIGSLSAAYSTNYAIGLNVSFRWERLNSAW
jgi:hypothetical protein